MTAVVIAAYISRELRGWFELFQARRKEREQQKDGDKIYVKSPPFFTLFWRNLIAY